MVENSAVETASEGFGTVVYESQTKGRLPQIPPARMNNFITDFRADPANRGVSRDHMMQAWMWLKSQPGPNTYAEYRQLKPAQPPSS